MRFLMRVMEANFLGEEPILALNFFQMDPG